MPLNVPASAAEVDARSKTDVQASLSLFGGNPFLRNSWLGALITAFANRIFDFYFALTQASEEAIPDTAVDLLDRWAAIWGVQRQSGTQAVGTAAVTGTAGILIPKSTLFTAGDGHEYESTADATIAASESLSVSSITRSGQVATLNAAAAFPAGLAANVRITVAGANEVQYNGTFDVASFVDLDTLTYAVAGSPATPATGTITYSFTSAAVPVRSLLFEEEANQLAGAVLTLQSPIAGVDDEVNANPAGLGGGSDQETDEALRSRMLDRIQNPIAHFNVAEITAVAKAVPGVTRVFVFEVTPAVGDVTVYFMRDNDSPAIPDGTEVQAVKDALDEIRPANTATGDLIVAAPTAVPTNYTFTALVPNTASMKAAIQASLVQFYAERTQVGQNVKADAYRSAIFNTVDTVTGDEVTSFTLSTPTGDVAITAGQIGTLGNVTFP